jgi:archaellum component FlaC
MFNGFDKKICDRMNTLEQKFTNVFDILKREMSEMKTEVGGAKQDVIEMKRKVNDLETCLEYQSKKLENKKMEDVSNMKSMSEKINEMDKNCFC